MSSLSRSQLEEAEAEAGGGRSQAKKRRSIADKRPRSIHASCDWDLENVPDFESVKLIPHN